MPGWRVLVLSLYVGVAAVIAVVWAWLGAPVAISGASGPGDDKLECVSYAPFRGAQTPLDPTTHIPASQIDDDLRRLAAMTRCVRTYSVDVGLDQVAGIAERYGLSVIQGLWLSSKPDKNRYQIEGTVALANKYPKTIRAIVVGNEVLLRGELGPADIAAIMREVKSRTSVPVTYADVWEFWLRNRSLADVADFVTVHILPYWEDDPIPAKDAAAHVVSIHDQVARAFPGKDVLIGEVGWPSAGRMREGALPSTVNEALVINEVLAAARRGHFRANVIEAFDQPWKRLLEGTTGGHWGLFDDATRTEKFRLGAPVSNHPAWIWQAAAGIAFAGLIFAAAFLGGRGAATASTAIAVAVIAIAGGSMIGLVVEKVPVESLGVPGWLRSLALAAAALLAPISSASLIAQGAAVPRFQDLLAHDGARRFGIAQRVAGWTLLVTSALATMTALGLTFNPRYLDFPYAPLTAAVLPFAICRMRRGALRPGLAEWVTAELVMAGLLVPAALFVVFNEGLANWQSLWLCADFVALAVTLVPVRGARD